jgi:hypothetical protein
VQNQAKVLTALGKELRKRNDAFDKSLTFLSKDQRKAVRGLRKAAKTGAEEERRQRFRSVRVAVHLRSRREPGITERRYAPGGPR